MGDLSGCPTKLENWKFRFEIFGFRYLCCCPTKLEYLKFKFEFFGFRYLCGCPTKLEYLKLKFEIFGFRYLCCCPTKLEYVEDIWNIFRRRFDRLEIVFESGNIFEALLRCFLFLLPGQKMFMFPTWKRTTKKRK